MESSTIVTVASSSKTIPRWQHFNHNDYHEVICYRPIKDDHFHILFPTLPWFHWWLDRVILNPDDMSQLLQYLSDTPAEKYEYQVEVSRFMDLIVNSLYNNKEVFLRELISDALDKLRFLSFTNPNLLKDGVDLDIRIQTNKDNGIITIMDSSIGMTRQELIDCLGTIAQSATANNIEEVITKFAQLTLQERTKRKLESLEVFEVMKKQEETRLTELTTKGAEFKAMQAEAETV
ncbi:hypothetical protein LOK49_LG05G00236 [Camellia lanceoleosa]|uniref:Uncharacterized protein n=1 Tax=Camellia lanceoleosa TaxID=1840588 RepID=A0ACC0HI58_9ERIC|nr:hypothetical protein LOK49_LG05G00236 [Camellia lanceoleosa]